jgi:hypothetical protein
MAARTRRYNEPRPLRARGTAAAAERIKPSQNFECIPFLYTFHKTPPSQWFKFSPERNPMHIQKDGMFFSRAIDILFYH